MIIKQREVTESELIEAARITSGSPHPDDCMQIVDLFKQMLELLRLT